MDLSFCCDPVTKNNPVVDAFTIGKDGKNNPVVDAFTIGKDDKNNPVVDAFTNGKDGKVSGAVPAQGSQNPRPVVILLGKGNSFSLGRSEVILLHAKQGRYHPHARSSNNKLVGDFSGNLGSDQASPELPPSGTDLSGLSHGVSGSGQTLVMGNDVNGGQTLAMGNDVNGLWERAELVMAMKEERVLKVLVKYGVGRGETRNMAAEEDVLWKAVEVGIDREAVEVGVDREAVEVGVDREGEAVQVGVDREWDTWR